MLKNIAREQYTEAIRMAWPAVLESVFVSLAGIIDTLMVSSMGTYAVAATGLILQPKFLSLSFFFAINVAVSALVARRLGQNNRRNANQVLVTSLMVVILLCIALTVVTVIFANPLIALCGSNADTHEGAVIYFRVIQIGMIFNVLSLVINAAQRGAGNTKIAMVTNVTSSIVNIIFNYLLIGGNFGFPKWGLFGAAFATVLGTVFACGMGIQSLFKKDSYVSIPYILEEKIKPDFGAFNAIQKLGANILFENWAMRVGFMTTAVLAAKLGTDQFAAYQVGMNILSLGFAFGDGMQVAAVSLIGKSLGQQKPELAKTYGHACQLIGVVISVIFAIVLLVGGRTLNQFFFADESVIEMGVMIARFVAVIVLFQISQIIYGGCLRGAGDVKYTLVVALISVTVIRPILTWVLTSVFSLGLVGIWLGVLSDQLTRFTLLRIRFHQGKWVEYKI